AGVERLAMLIDEPAAEHPDVILAVENDEVIGDGQRLLKALRGDGLSADMIATGSPRKRYDKAAKIPAKVLVSINRKDGETVFNTRSASPSDEHARVQQILAQLKEGGQ
ncbi:MAG TPA: histidine--tRNA ligase, partial [Sphingomonas sp.]|nr:histidine--tRNA ligase [Sphingomonas sp.]